MLPNPFTARELAAFMLDGTGSLVAHCYGERDDGPDPDSLRAIDPDSKARRAVTEAFTAYREAEGIVGPYPRALQADADRARKAYNEANQRANEREGVSGAVPGTDDSTARRARAVASVAAQEAKMHTTIAASRQASEAWLTKMVRCLLEPQAAAPALHVATEPTQEQRQAYRWQLCIDAGLTMPEGTYSHLPRGIGKVAESLGITRQALQQDLNAHRERLFGK